MHEIMINGQAYPLRFGMGFLREINRKTQQTDSGIKKNVGLRFAVAGLMDGDVESLCDVLLTANKTELPRISARELDEYLENDYTDIDQIFDNVLDFLSKANVTKKTMAEIQKVVDGAKNPEA